MIIVTEPSDKKVPELKLNRVVGYIGEDRNYEPIKNEPIKTDAKNDCKEHIISANKILFASLIYYSLVLLLSHYSGSNVTLTMGAATVLFPGFLSLFCS